MPRPRIKARLQFATVMSNQDALLNALARIVAVQSTGNGTAVAVVIDFMKNLPAIIVMNTVIGVLVYASNHIVASHVFISALQMRSPNGSLTNFLQTGLQLWLFSSSAQFVSIS